MIKMYTEVVHNGIFVISEVFQEHLKFKILNTLNISFINEVYTLKLET